MVLITLLVGALLVGAIATFIVLGIASPVPWLFLLSIAALIFYSRNREKEQYLIWKDEYSVGIEAIDDDHKKLLNLINQFQTAVHYRTEPEFEDEAFAAVLDYTKTHFQREEQLMSEHGYPKFEAHQQEHRKMIAQVEASLAQYKGEQRHVALKRLLAFLKNWLINHINGTDQAYSGFLRDKGVR